MENLDLRCAELGATLAGAHGVEEKTLTDALAVLEEQGVYAFFLYLSAPGRNGGGEVSRACHKFLQQEPSDKALLPAGGDVLRSVRESLANELDNLLLARDLLRQALVYGRYHAKAESRGIR